jgi:hypothetical protein
MIRLVAYGHIISVRCISSCPAESVSLAESFYCVEKICARGYIKSSICHLCKLCSSKCSLCSSLFSTCLDGSADLPTCIAVFPKSNVRLHF